MSDTRRNQPSIDDISSAKGLLISSKEYFLSDRSPFATNMLRQIGAVLIPSRELPEYTQLVLGRLANSDHRPAQAEHRKEILGLFKQCVDEIATNGKSGEQQRYRRALIEGLVNSALSYQTMTAHYLMRRNPELLLACDMILDLEKRFVTPSRQKRLRRNRSGPDAEPTGRS